MKAIAVTPGKRNSIHLEEIPKPSVDDVAGGKGVLVQVLRVGVDGTDKEINDAEYGAVHVPPPDLRRDLADPIAAQALLPGWRDQLEITPIHGDAGLPDLIGPL